MCCVCVFVSNFTREYYSVTKRIELALNNTDEYGLWSYFHGIINNCASDILLVEKNMASEMYDHFFLILF